MHSANEITNKSNIWNMRYIVIDLNLAEDCNRAVKHNTPTNKHPEIMGPAF